MLKVGDEIIVIADVPFKGEINTITHVSDGIAYTSDYVGYWAETGAGRLAKKDDEPFVRKLTKLDRALA